VRYERYRRIENAITASDKGGIWERWRYGRRLLCDDQATTPNGNLQHGVLDRLIRGAARSGGKLSEREIQRRVQCGRTYPAESQIRRAATDFETWRDLYQASFPDYEADPDERPYDPRETDELARGNDARGKRLMESASYGQDLFGALDQSLTLAEVQRWLDEQDEITARYKDIGQRRRLAFAELAKAVNGDLSKTLAEAEWALDEESLDEDDDDDAFGDDA
jgi:hypothetical protein